MTVRQAAAAAVGTAAAGLAAVACVGTAPIACADNNTIDADSALSAAATYPLYTYTNDYEAFNGNSYTDYHTIYNGSGIPVTTTTPETLPTGYTAYGAYDSLDSSYATSATAGYESEYSSYAYSETSPDGTSSYFNPFSFSYDSYNDAAQNDAAAATGVSGGNPGSSVDSALAAATTTYPVFEYTNDFDVYNGNTETIYETTYNGTGIPVTTTTTESLGTGVTEYGSSDSFTSDYLTGASAGDYYYTGYDAYGGTGPDGFFGGFDPFYSDFGTFTDGAPLEAAAAAAGHGVDLLSAIG